MTERNEDLRFRVSSGLKNIIGRDLINNKYIAIFELVKNSYDAGASKVDISFVKNNNGKEQIIIADNGCGMTYEDIVNKWLFVAYSEKKTINRDEHSYRNRIKREVAGAKGVGRFSCDRLGEILTLITKSQSNQEQINKIYINWNKFEQDDTQNFIDIPVQYTVGDKHAMVFSHGTTLIIDSLRESWSREDLLRLKRSLMKLISPDVSEDEIPFEIELIVPEEQAYDQKMLQRKGVNPKRDIVNGVVHNDVFEKLDLKTTSISVDISENGLEYKTCLFDRGQFIFSIDEKNRRFNLLKNITIKIFFLNRAAKINFGKQMGVQPINYGSVFVYKNGFRINPYGEPGQDFFRIDQRKTQGWKRYLGTREIMGRISIKGKNDGFIETTSRADGFVRTPTVVMLEDFFLERVLKVLEKYVVNLINWGEPLKTEPDHTITPDEIGDQIVSQFFTNINSADIVDVNYNQDIFVASHSQDKQNALSLSIKKLEAIAVKTGNEKLSALAQSIKKKSESILSQNVHLEAENKEAEKQLAQAKEEEEARVRQIYFLQGSSNQNVTNLLNGFHSIYTLTDATKGNVQYLKELLAPIVVDNKDLIFTIVAQIQQANEKAYKLAELAIHGSQTLKSKGANNIYDYIRQYIDAGLAVQGLNYKLEKNNKLPDCKFDTSSIGIILDNIASNSIKAGATVLNISFKDEDRFVKIIFTDNGLGLSSDIDPHSIFEWGFSSNREKKGFGIGLYHVKQLVDEMKGKIEIDTNYKDGFKLIVRLKK